LFDKPILKTSTRSHSKSKRF